MSRTLTNSPSTQTTEHQLAIRKAIAAINDEERRQVADYLSQLSHGVKFALERTAIEQADPAIKTQFWQVYNKKPAQEQKIRALIVHHHVMKQLAESLG